LAPGSCPPWPGSITMRDTLNPSCLAMENPPSRLRDGVLPGIGGVVALVATGDAGRRGGSTCGGGISTRASASAAVAEGASTGATPIQPSVRCRIDSSSGAGLAGNRGAASASAAGSADGFKQSITKRYGL